MSLQVWLPLNGSLSENISNRIFTNNSATINNAGKIGKCYDFNGSSAQLIHQLSSNDISMINSCTQFTLACWVKLASNQDSWGQIVTFGSQGTNWNDIRIGFDAQPNSSTHFSVSDGSSNAGYKCSSNNNLADDKWHHLVGIYDNKKLIMYVDGVQQTLSNTVAFTHVLGPTSYIIIGGNSSEKPKCSINDVRFYNHALSPREAKLLAQGLVAHYKLDGGHLEDTINYDPAKNAMSTKSLGNDIFAYGAGTTTTYGNYFGYNCFKVNIKTTSYSGWTGSYMLTVPASQGISVGGIATRSCWMYVPSGQNKPNHFTESFEGTIDSNNASTIQYDFNKCNTWQKVSMTAKVYNDTKFIHYFYAADIGYPGYNFEFYIRDFQLEAKDHSSVFTETSRFNEKEYDCSGYGNHGTKSTSFNFSKDSLRYKNCAIFENNKYISIPSRSYEGMKNSYTFSYWAKHGTDTAMDGKMVWGFHDGGYLDIYPTGGCLTWNTGDGASNPFVNNSTNVTYPTDGLWHHYAITGNGSQVLLYIDGEYRGKAKTYKSMPNSGTLFLSGWNASENYYRWNGGQTSDFRIYATALSAAAIKELYQSSISFLNNGTLQCSEIVENSTNLKYNQNGTVQIQEFRENNQSKLMKIERLPDGSVWARINYLNARNNSNATSTYFNGGATEVAHCANQSNRFSLMDQVNNFIQSNNTYEFRLTYPDAYEQLEYIETTGNQFIDTGVYPYAEGSYVRGHKWEFDIHFVSNTGRHLMGYGPWRNEYWGVNNGMYELGYSISSMSAGARHKVIHDFSQGTAGNNKLYVNGNDANVIASGEGLASNEQYILFGLKWSGTSDYGSSARLYECKCFQGSQLIRHFIPVRKKGGTVGLIDIVNGKFYANSGTGEFIAGPVVKNTHIHNRWTQTNSPNVNYDSASGYTKISTAFYSESASTYVGPLTYSKSSSSALYSANRSGNWWSPVGQYSYFNPSSGVYGIPASDANTYQETELWVRIDQLKNINYLTKLSMLDDAIQAFQIYEL